MKDCIKLKLWIKGKNIFKSAHVYSFLQNAFFLNIKFLNLKYQKIYLLKIILEQNMPHRSPTLICIFQKLRSSWKIFFQKFQSLNPIFICNWNKNIYCLKLQISTFKRIKNSLCRKTCLLQATQETFHAKIIQGALRKYL